MKYVYILESRADADRYYVGLTDDVAARLVRHNAGDVTHTAKFRPWALKNSFGFANEVRAAAFERYLKSGSGRAFAKKHF